MFKGIVLGLILAGSAQAGTGYFGGSAGQSSFDVDGFSTDFNQDTLGWKGYAGYNFNKFIGTEVGYVDFGNPKNGERVSCREGDVKVEPTAWEGYVVGTLPVGPVDLFAKAGGAVLEANFDSSRLNDTTNSENVFAYGGGVGFNFGRFGIKAEIEAYDSNTLNDLYFASAGLVIRL